MILSFFHKIHISKTVKYSPQKELITQEPIRQNFSVKTSFGLDPSSLRSLQSRHLRRILHGSHEPSRTSHGRLHYARSNQPSIQKSWCQIRNGSSLLQHAKRTRIRSSRIHGVQEVLWPSRSRYFRRTLRIHA